MALTTIETNNKLIRFTQDINREYVRENMFSPYMGEDHNAIIRVRNELKSGGEIMNVPMVTRLKAAAIGSQSLVDAEELIDNYGMRVKLGWARNAVLTNAAETQKDSADIFGEAKPLLSDWGKDLQRDDIIQAFMAVPSALMIPSAPANQDVRANGILFAAATTTGGGDLDTWLGFNSDRVLFGKLKSNFSAGVWATARDTLDVTDDKLTAPTLALMKRIAKNADPHIRPFKTRDGYEYFVAFAGTGAFRDLKSSLETINKDARPREGRQINGAPDTPLFQDGDQIYDGVIVREVPEITTFARGIWDAKLTTTGGVKIEPVFLCGQQAMAFCWGQMAKPTFRKEDDYQFKTGVGVQMAYGVAKNFKGHPMTPGTTLKQWGVVTGFFAAPADA